jgi:serine/threonine protein kinase
VLRCRLPEEECQTRVPCFDEDAILDLVAGRLHLDAVAEAHLAGCAACARLLGAANVTLKAGTRAPGPGADGSPSQPQAITEIDAATPSRSSGRLRPALESGTVLKGTYQIGRLLGRGGMGEVYEVNHLRLAGHYAVKVLRAEVSDDDELLSRFRREATISSALRHPNIIQVFDFDRTDDGCVYLAMEYLEGEDLAHLLARQGQLPLDRVLRLAAQMASALTAAHRRGVVHRDLKPANVFIVRDDDELAERVKIMDFGLSKWSSTALERSVSLSHDQALIGTPRYMSPEQASGRNKEVGPASDQFALAAIVYEMLAGVPAFGGETVAQLLYAIVHQPAKELATHRPDLPPGLSEAIVKALSKAPADRFPSVQNFHHALAGATSRELNPPRRQGGRRRTMVASAALLVFGLATAAWALMTETEQPVDVAREVAAPARSASVDPATMPAALPPAAGVVDLPRVPQAPPVRPAARRHKSALSAPPPAPRAPPDAGPPLDLELIPNL